MHEKVQIWISSNAPNRSCTLFRPPLFERLATVSRDSTVLFRFTTKLNFFSYVVVGTGVVVGSSVVVVGSSVVVVGFSVTVVGSLVVVGFSVVVVGSSVVSLGSSLEQEYGRNVFKAERSVAFSFVHGLRQWVTRNWPFRQKKRKTTRSSVKNYVECT